VTLATITSAAGRAASIPTGFAARPGHAFRPDRVGGRLSIGGSFERHGLAAAEAAL
jgi:hypothetical protein